MKSIRKGMIFSILVSSTIIVLIEMVPRFFPKLVYVILPPHISAILTFSLDYLKKYGIENGAMMEDDTLGYVLKPKAQLTMQTPDYNVKYFFSSITLASGKIIGINDRIEGDIFAVAVGDSFTFCSGVPQEKCWTEVLEEMLGREVLNLGVFGYGSVQKYFMLKESIEFKPKIAIFQYGFGDIVDDKYFLSGKSYPIPHPQNMFRKTENILLRESFIVSTIWTIIFLINFPDNVMKEYYSMVQYEFSNQTLKYIEKSAEISERNGTRFFLLFSPRDKFVESMLCAKIKCITPALGPEHFFKYDPHLNEKGNRFIAEEIFKTILSIIK